MDTQELLSEIKQSVEDIKGLDISVLDVKEKSSYADYLVICHGTSTAHAKGISEKVEMNLKKKHRQLPLGVEGFNEGSWILMDYNAVIVHIFEESVREDYQLEELFTAVSAGRDEEDAKD